MTINLYQWITNNSKNASFDIVESLPFILLHTNQYGFFLHIFLTNLMLINIRHKFKKITFCLHLECNRQLRYNDDNFKTHIRNLSKMYQKTYEVIELFNEIFGWPILCSVMMSSLFLLLGLTFISVYSNNIELEVKLSPMSLIIFQIETLFFIVS